MNKRPLGRSGIEAAPLALGGNVFGWTVDEPTSFRLLDAFVEGGFDLVDTADVYSRWGDGNQGGELETIIGNWMALRRNRRNVIVATKAGNEMGPDKKGLSKAYILQAAEDSLRRLKTDYIDLYQSHIDDPETPLEETLSAYAQLMEQGKVRAIGASNYGDVRLSESLKVSREKGLPRYESLQPHYNLMERSAYEAELEPLCLKEQTGVIPYFALARGFLTGKYRSEGDLTKSPRGQGVKQYLNDRGFRVLAALKQVARQYDTKMGSVALAWLMARPSITAPIASATNLDQMADLIIATKLNLDLASIELLNLASAPE